MSLVGAFILGGCAARNEEAASRVASQAIAPIPRPERPIGYQAIRRVNGIDEVYTLVAKTADTETWNSSSGCQAVYPRTGLPQP